MGKLFTCSDCGNTYEYAQSLKRHVKKNHPDKIVVKSFKFSCDKCNRKYNKLKNFNYHKRTKHQAPAAIVFVACPMCKETFSKTDIFNHFETTHDVTLETENLEFSSLDAFYKWKDEMEKNSRCSLRKSNGSHKTPKTNKHYFMCHRSGEFLPRGSGLRRVKSQGSKKIGGFCPAQIKVIESRESGKVTIYFTKTHVGHQNELKHLTLTADERNLIATKIASKIPFDSILDEIKNSLSKDSLQRIHLLTRKDLHNICTSFNLNGAAVQHKNDETNLEIVPEKEDNNETQILKQELEKICSSRKPNENIALLKKELKRKFDEAVDNVTTTKELEIIKNMVNSLQPSLCAVRSTSVQSFSTAAASNSSLLNILGKKKAAEKVKHIQPTIYYLIT